MDNDKEQQPETDNTKAEAVKSSVFQTVIVIICVAGTIALIVAGAFFAVYYTKNKDNIFIADISYERHKNRHKTPLPETSFQEAMFLKAHFEWGGCRTEDHDQIKGTFRLHCWGLTHDSNGVDKEIERLENVRFSDTDNPLKRGLRVTSFKKENLNSSKKFLLLLSAFCYHKLHLDIVAPEDKPE